MSLEIASTGPSVRGHAKLSCLFAQSSWERGVRWTLVGRVRRRTVAPHARSLYPTPPRERMRPKNWSDDLLLANRKIARVPTTKTSSTTFIRKIAVLQAVTGNFADANCLEIWKGPLFGVVLYPFRAVLSADHAEVGYVATSQPLPHVPARGHAAVGSPYFAGAFVGNRLGPVAGLHL
jgi:hypothetical protein